jgi:hypothetical protein
MNIDRIIYYYQGLYGVAFFDADAASYTYVHENDGEFDREEYMNPLLQIVGAKLQRALNFNHLHIRIKTLLFDMEDSTEEDYGDF